MTCIDLSESTSTSKNQLQYIIRGRIICRRDCDISNEVNANLTVDLQDTSLADAPAVVISRTIGKIVQFPRRFAVKYSASQISDGHTYSLSVTIKNDREELLYINDVHIGVIPLGARRTKFIDVPVIRVKSK